MKNVKFLIIIVTCVILAGASTFALTSYLQSKPDEPIPIDYIIVGDTSIPSEENVPSIENVTPTVPETETTEVIETTEVTEPTETEIVEPTEETEVVEPTETEDYIEEEEGTGGDWEPEGGNIYDYLTDEDDVKVSSVTTPEFIEGINTILYEGCIDEAVTFYSFEDNALSLIGEKYMYTISYTTASGPSFRQILLSELFKEEN